MQLQMYMSTHLRTRTLK